jgi:hypothetical protein
MESFELWQNDLCSYRLLSAWETDDRFTGEGQLELDKLGRNAQHLGNIMNCLVARGESMVRIVQICQVGEKGRQPI